MNDAVNAKFGLFGLLKLLDRFQGGELHDELAAIAQGLGLELPVVANSEDEADNEAQASEQDRVYQFLASQPGPVALAQIVTALEARRWTVTTSLYRLQRKGRVQHPSHDAWQIRPADPSRSEGESTG